MTLAIGAMLKAGAGTNEVGDDEGTDGDAAGKLGAVVPSWKRPAQGALPAAETVPYVAPP